jgi:hypothetical protein
VADTEDGTAGGTGINGNLSGTAFNLGSANPWQAALVNQPLGRAPNNDSYTGESFSLTGQTGRFLALVADSYYGGNGLALGKARVRAGQGTLTYTPVVEDLGKYLIFEVTPVATAGIRLGPAAWAAIGPSNAPPVATTVTITGTPAVGQVLQGGYHYSDAEGDIESGTTFQWYRSNDGTLDGGDTAIAGATNSSYTVKAGDSGKTLFFQVTPRAATGSPTGSAGASAGVPIPAAPPVSSQILIKENFGGIGAALNGTSADTFALGIVVAGGSSTWVADAVFLDNGVVTLATRVGAYLNLGSYIDDTRGTADGKFDLTMTISPTTGTWISLGFATQNAPSTMKDFTNSGSGTSNTTGIATMVYRATNAPGEIDMWGGPLTGGAVDGPDNNTGNRMLTVSLDLTPAGGYNGVNNFGKVTWSDSVLGALGGYTYTSAQNFGSILVTDSYNSSGTISALTLTQIWFPLLQITLNGENLDFQWSSRAGMKYDLVATNNLLASIVTWPPYNDGVTTYTNIPASPTDLNVLTNVLKLGAAKFFMLIERPG